MICPFCRKAQVHDHIETGYSFAMCHACGARGPSVEWGLGDEAIEEANQKALAAFALPTCDTCRRKDLET